MINFLAILGCIYLPVTVYLLIYFLHNRIKTGRLLCLFGIHRWTVWWPNMYHNKNDYKTIRSIKRDCLNCSRSESICVDYHRKWNADDTVNIEEQEA